MEIPKFSGFLPDPIDLRDIPLGLAIGDITLPFKYDALEGMTLKVEDQNGSSSCVAQTFSKYAEVLNSYETHQFADLSAKFIYSRIYLPTTGGAYLRDACKVLTNLGVSPEYLDPSYPATEERMRQIETEPMVLSSAKVYKAKSYVQVVNDLSELKKAIYSGKGIGIGANVGQIGWGYQAVKNNGGYVTMPQSGEEYGGHAFYIHAYDDENQRFTLLNSWSKNWGLDGHAYLRYNDVGWLYSGWTIVDAPNDLINTAKDMYNLIRNPNKPTEVYALTGNIVRHIANLQTLKLGDKEPDRFWKWEGVEIPTAILNDWNTYMETDEIHIDPKD
jgi:C1A family cysteine protease